MAAPDDIQAALFNFIRGVIPADIKVAWDNKDFKEPPGIYARVRDFPAQPVRRTVRKPTKHYYSGMLLVVISVPGRVGPDAGDSLADAIVIAVDNTATLRANDTLLLKFLRTPTINAGIQDDTHYSRPISIYYGGMG